MINSREQKVLDTLNPSLDNEEMTDIQNLEKISVAKTIEEYAEWDTPENIFRKLLRWKMFKEMYATSPKWNFSDEIFEIALDKCMEAPQEFRDAITEWIEGGLDNESLLKDSRFTAQTEKEVPFKNFFHILLEVNHA